MKTILPAAYRLFGLSKAALYRQWSQIGSGKPRWIRQDGLLAAAILALCALTAYAADPETLPDEFEAAYHGEPGAGVAPDWRTIFIDTGRDYNSRYSPFGSLRESRRFGLFDNQAYRGLYIPLTPTWRAALDASVDPAREAFTPNTLGTQIQKILPGDWIAGVGFRRNEYARVASQARTFSLERHFGDVRAAYTLFSGKSESGASAPAHRVQFSYHYGSLSSVGLAYSTGREFDSMPAGGLFGTDVRNWTLSGRHWFARDWAVTYEALSERQTGLYRREGLRLGLRYRF